MTTPSSRPLLTRLEARLGRFLFHFVRTDLAVGDLVELTANVRYRGRVDADHLTSCAAGTRARITAIGPMGHRAGVVLRLTDGDGEPTRYWTGADLSQVRRLLDDL